MKKFITIILTISILLSNLLTISVNASTIKSNQSKPTTQYYYGIVSGNGITSTVYLKVGSTYQSYTIKSSYIGHTARLITTDKPITLKNYKQIQILNTSEIEYTNNDQINEVNKLITEYNNMIVANR